MERIWHALGTVLLAGALAACGGGGGGGGGSAPAVGSATLDAAGGTVDGPDGVTLAVPAGALADATTIRIAADASGAPDLGGAQAITPIYAVTPHGQAFASAARITIPFDADQVVPGTRPVLLRAQPGGRWEVLATDVLGGKASAADTPGLSFYAVGTCLDPTTDPSPYGPGALLACPAAHELKLVLRDGSDAEVPLVRNADGVALPVMTISAPTTLRTTLRWTRPAGTQRTDRLHHSVFGIGLLPSEQPLPVDGVPTSTDFVRDFAIPIDPAKVSGASAANGVVVRIRAAASYTTDAFYISCVCFRPATWAFSTEIPIRVIYTGTTPTITAQPQDRSVVEGQTAAFAVTATGPNLSWQWSSFKNLVQTVIAGATQASYTTPATSRAANDNTLYAVQVCSNRDTALERCVESNAALLRVTPFTAAPAFTQGPASISVVEGQTASFSAVASGTPAPAVTWARVIGTGALQQREPVCGTTTGTSGSTNATCTIGPVTLADSGKRFGATATNAAGSVNSALATLTVTALPVAPAITTPAQPDDRSVTAGQAVSWTIAASGTAPLSYQWRSVAPNGTVNGNVVCAGGASPGQSTGPTLNLPSVPLACNGYRFEVEVSNGVLPKAVSRRALLTVNPAPAAPAITTGLSDRSVPDGTQVTFSVAATGTPSTFATTWTLGGVPVASPVSGCTGTSATCSFVAQLADHGKTVRVVVANGVAPDAASQATLSVTTTDVAASITQPPQSIAVDEGSDAVFSVTATGTPTPTLQWQTSSDGAGTWTDVSSGGTGSTLTLSAVTLADSGLKVRVVATNTVQTPTGPEQATATSAVATLTVATVVTRSWQTAALLQNSAFQTEGAVPEIATDGAGNMRAAWIERTLGGVNTIVTARLTPAGGWEAPVTVAALGGESATQVKVAVNDLGHAVLAWRQLTAGVDTVWAQTYTPIGGWQTQVRLDVDNGTSYSPLGLAMDAAGNAIVLWRHDIVGSGGASGIFHARFVPGSGWTTASALALGANVTAAFSPSVGFDASGNAVAVWMQSGIAGSNAASARWLPGSGWTATEVIETGNDAVSEPQVAVNANGAAAAVWLQNGRVWSNRYTPGAGWGSAVPADTAGSPPLAPQVAIDSSGNALAVWRQSDGTRPRIWANRATAGGAWGTAATISAAGVEGYDPALAGNAAGRGVAVWRSYDAAVGRYTTTAAVFTPAGGWGAAQAIEPTEQSRPPKVAVDPNGDAVVVWPRQGTNAWQVWSNRFR
jgi:hypothetical protein